METFKDILILSPHTDDAEFGCGGLISKFREMGVNVYVIVFSLCEQSVPRHLPRDILKKEFYASSKVLNIPKEFIFTASIPVRIFPERRQEILDRMITLKKDLNPDLVIVPSLKDTHQDHIRCS